MHANAFFGFLFSTLPENPCGYKDFEVQKSDLPRIRPQGGLNILASLFQGGLTPLPDY
jgi:hypothetical protein